MKLLLLGAPGSGKGTQAHILADRLSIPHISTGDMLRTAVRDATPLGQMAKQIMEKGELLPDDVMLGLVQERLQQADCVGGFILDGFPRTKQQAQSLADLQLGTLHIVNIIVPFASIVARISGRRVHLASGRAYHIVDNPPREEGKDDVTGEPLIHRDDDKEATVQVRLDVYQQEITAMIDFYSDATTNAHYVEIDGIGTIDDVAGRIVKAVTS